MENKKVDPAERKIALIGLSFMALCFSIFFIWLSGGFNFSSQEIAKEDAKSSISNDTSISNEGGQSEPAKPSYGDESCRYKVDANISGAGGMHTGIAYRGEGVFFALVANSTTNYKYIPVLFYTDADCNITNVVVK